MIVSKVATGQLTSPTCDSFRLISFFKILLTNKRRGLCNVYSIIFILLMFIIIQACYSVFGHEDLILNHTNNENAIDANGYFVVPLVVRTPISVVSGGSSGSGNSDSLLELKKPDSNDNEPSTKDLLPFEKIIRAGKKRPGHGLLTQGGKDPDKDIQQKRDFIKNMMKDAWKEYTDFAWGTNELRPISKMGQTGGSMFGNKDIGATIIDSLSTLHIMGFKANLRKSREWIQKNFNMSGICDTVSLFETNIRIVGGFLSAYALTSDKLYLDKAVQVGRLLLPAFKTKFGIPSGSVSPCNGKSYGGHISLAEIGTLHLEFVYLSRLTKDPIFEDSVQKIRNHLYKKLDSSGLYKNSVSAHTGEFSSDETSLGGGADSFYEYIMKSWIHTGDEFARKMYEEAINAMINSKMMRYSTKSHLLYFGSVVTGIMDSSKPREEFSHLACFAGGMFALGSSSRPDSYPHKLRDLEIGKNLTHTCHESYVRTSTGLGPEVFSMADGHEARMVQLHLSYYILRPEVIESYFILYRITKDPKYRDWGWAAALAIEKWCKAGPGLGYSGIRRTDARTKKNTRKDDIQPTFFLAETLKYLYLLFSSSDLVDLEYWVFNTEAHPLPVKGKNPMF